MLFLWHVRVCYSPSPCSHERKGQSSGCDDFLAKGAVYDGQGYQICTHWGLCTQKVQLRMRARLHVLTGRVGDSISLQVLPKFKNKPEMIGECLKRKLIKKGSNHSAQKFKRLEGTRVTNRHMQRAVFGQRANGQRENP